MNTALIFPDLSYPWAQMGLRKKGQLIAQPYQLPGLHSPSAPLRRSPFMTKRSQQLPPTTPVCLHGTEHFWDLAPCRYPDWPAGCGTNCGDLAVAPAAGALGENSDAYNEGGMLLKLPAFKVLEKSCVPCTSGSPGRKGLYPTLLMCPTTYLAGSFRQVIQVSSFL